jgi:hypothetical protein
MPPVRNWPSLAGCALAILFGCPGLSAQSGVVTIRVVDARNGKPYRKLHLRVDLLRAPWSSQVYRNGSNPWAVNLIATKLETTNEQGEVAIEMPTPLPGEIMVWSAMACGGGFFDAQTVMEKGVVGDDRCRTKWTKMNVKFQARPGEIIYFATHVGFLEGALTK